MNIIELNEFCILNNFRVEYKRGLVCLKEGLR